MMDNDEHQARRELEDLLRLQPSRGTVADLDRELRRLNDCDRQGAPPEGACGESRRPLARH